MDRPGNDATDRTAGHTYGLGVANDSYTWYRKAAARAKWSYQVGECLLVLVAAAIPVAAVLRPDDATVPAILGGVVVVLSSLRGIFHWQENYLRFSRAREAVEAERRLYLTSGPPYDNVTTRDAVLVAKVTQIQQEELGGWLQIAAERPTLDKG
ncbi:MAG TPA: DUF4231 domain-containing protein [Catenuloplanes sp.]